MHTDEHTAGRDHAEVGQPADGAGAAQRAAGGGQFEQCDGSEHGEEHAKSQRGLGQLECAREGHRVWSQPLSIAVQPMQARQGSGARLVLEADPTIVAEPFERCEYAGKIDLAVDRLVALGHAGDLDVTDQRHQLLQRGRDVAVQDLAMVDIVLQADVGEAELADDAGGKVEVAQEVAGVVAQVQRLEQGCSLVGAKLLGGVAERGLERLRARILAGAAHDVDLVDAGRLDVAQHGVDRGAEVRRESRAARRGRGHRRLLDRAAY